MSLSGKNILLGVTGGIAAYKSAELTSKLVKSGAEVHVVMTESAKKFIGPATFQALTRHPVYDSVFIEEKDGQIAHIDLADSADLFIVVPATANTIGKLASGLADDMLTAAALASRCPVWIAPAMNVNMYTHPAVQKNLRTLESFGYRLIGPDAGWLACGWTGKGRMTEPDEIFNTIDRYFSAEKKFTLPLAGKKILVTAGPTREALDPIRFFSNQSSGKMGYAIAEAAGEAGADVTLISGPSALSDPSGISVIRVTSADEMRREVLARYEHADAVIKAAAVADYRPESVSGSKIKKADGPLLVKMVRNPDILMELGRIKKSQLLVGFAAETEQLEDNARAKLEKKHLDLLIANHAADGFAKDTNKVTFFFADGHQKAYGEMPKKEIAEKICRTVSELMETSGQR
ncbi:bifunctional phosphopantothenoylcysteine decarboxylase/phosphopantothenate--cysteine ligase CoaBC [Sporolactobacillus shoreae]|uniref:Coenzyme A biosynthesis bifunctional protein CoaBC n=1 Tax=Sporolactobacillus shoreae TaxID=1465501 RepID=A0A4Z0GU08_9BACL|nr:bifunctional phosphopantothenoylcysteine decarboxylase/phosphopantothenate--cysteine ligase CoaBC [Sporolactobacillus shoreae]TGB00470.1 bifunctional phosphopantothenoylcysteine decarboxylase/phosphopantothenate--cysteine ligase CoaBC [Sporolactobacillus shoreae]